MCECCQMRKMPDGSYCGKQLPRDNMHIVTGSTVLQIMYDIYIEHFYLRIITKSLFKLKASIHQLNNCPNCGANLFDVWDNR